MLDMRPSLEMRARLHGWITELLDGLQTRPGPIHRYTFTWTINPQRVQLHTACTKV